MQKYPLMQTYQLQIQADAFPTLCINNVYILPHTYANNTYLHILHRNIHFRCLIARAVGHPTQTPGNFDYPTPTPTPTFSCISYLK